MSTRVGYKNTAFSASPILIKCCLFSFAISAGAFITEMTDIYRKDRTKMKMTTQNDKYVSLNT